jgi:hypothetical protein
MIRQTHTYAILPLSPAAYQEIREKLLAAGYGHAVHDRNDPAPHSGECIDMHGLAVQSEKEETNGAVAAKAAGA